MRPALELGAVPVFPVPLGLRLSYRGAWNLPPCSPASHERLHPPHLPCNSHPPPAYDYSNAVERKNLRVKGREAL